MSGKTNLSIKNTDAHLTFTEMHLYDYQDLRGHILWTETKLKGFRCRESDFI